MIELIKSRLRSFAFAGSGIAQTMKTQPNARIHAIATGAVVILGFSLHVSPLEWCLLLLAIGTVWIAELLNTALEYLVDLASPEYHILAKHAKDCAAGAVLVASLIALFIGMLIMLPKVLSWIDQVLF
ncbi:MAG: diacylglycerol kinase family protein [Saprospirales bacterium]|nr:diacylglycerol kinase family protein [Saprospirales bacterium]MBK8489457.1 diacylglycerol kinase family protein [Saprospirales bacterium]